MASRDQLSDELAPYYFAPSDAALAVQTARELAASPELLRERAEAARARVRQDYAQCVEIGIPWHRFLSRLWLARPDRTE